MIKRSHIQLAVLIVTAVILGVCLSACKEAQTASTSKQPATNPISLPASVSGNEAIRFLEDRIKRDPDDFVANGKLASAYLQQLRETGDITYLNLASRAARASLATLPAEQNKGGLAALTQVEFSSHDFVGARDHAKRLIELEPNKGYPYQFLGDALMELGQYDEAEAAFKEMSELGGIQAMTNVAIEQRVARMALLRGDNKGAMRHFSIALKIAAAMPEPPKETVAWCQWQLGETAFATGDHKGAEKYYRDSLSTFPDYFHSLAALGRIRAAQGDLGAAIEHLEKAVRILPDLNFVATLGDLYKLSGRDRDAEDQYTLVEKIGQLSSAGGSLHNRSLALFYADHDLKAEDAYSATLKEYEARRDIYGADAVAWTALKAGKPDEARATITYALRLGTRDARLYYHAGMIENALGNRSEARRFLKLSLKTNPGFDPLQSSIARKTLEALK